MFKTFYCNVFVECLNLFKSLKKIFFEGFLEEGTVNAKRKKCSKPFLGTGAQNISPILLQICEIALY